LGRVNRLGDGKMKTLPEILNATGGGRTGPLPGCRNRISNGPLSGNIWGPHTVEKEKHFLGGEKGLGLKNGVKKTPGRKVGTVAVMKLNFQKKKSWGGGGEVSRLVEKGKKDEKVKRN